MLTAYTVNIDTEIEFVHPIWLTSPHKACVTGVVQGTAHIAKSVPSLQRHWHLCRPMVGLDQWRPWSCDPIREGNCTGRHVWTQAGLVYPL